MHTGVISFCDRIGFNIKSSDTKEEILRVLHAKFQVQILQKHWHKLDAEGVTHLYRSPHFACLRSNGNPYYMFFTRYEDVPIIYYIDKKIQPGYQVPRVILARGKWGESVFEDSLLEGEMVKDKYGGWVFLINDVIAYRGEYLWKLTLPERLEYGYRMLSEHYQPDTIMDVCRFQVKKYAHATQEGISELIALSNELPYTSRGLYFWPFSRKFKPKLYNFDDSLVKSVSRKVKDNPEFMDATLLQAQAAPEPTSMPDTTVAERSRSPSPIKSQGENVLWLRKTETPDVYDVHGSANMASKKLGIAHVPSLKISKMLRAEFKDATVAVMIQFACAFNEKWQKWEPLRRAVIQD